MIEVRRLHSHDPLPGGHSITVLLRFEEERPNATMVEMVVSHKSGAEETSRPVGADGRLLDLDEAIEQAIELARRKGLTVVYRIDRTAGPREQDILAHGGDHGVNGELLSDDDMEEGERGPDMRDRYR